MISFLSKEKDLTTYEEKLATIPKQTRRNKLYAVKVFENFVRENYNRTIKDIIIELQNLRRTKEQETYDDALYGMLQDWINWNEMRGIGNYTIRVLFSNLRKYLFHVGIKTHDQDIKEYLRFGKKNKDERYPLTQGLYRQIINGFGRNPRLQTLFLAMGSSGMRVGEAINLKKKDLDLNEKRIKVTISNTKTRVGRTTFLSRETKNLLRPLLEELGPDDYVFAKRGCRLYDQVVRKSLNRILDRLGFTDTYQSNRYRKITTHSFRAYFFTKAARKHGENYAHKIVGHGGYLMQYDRMTEKEKLDMYIQLESDLIIFDQTKNEIKIEKLQKENESIEQLRKEVNELRKYQSLQDKKILEEMREKGIISYSE